MPAKAQRRPAGTQLSRSVEGAAVSIAGREISRQLPPYIVAELSCNHGGDIHKAKRLIYAAKAAGADAVKLQTYTPAELTTPVHQDLWSLYERAQTPREWHAELFEHAAEVGITIFSSAFSPEGVRFLADLGAPAIKIASAEIYDRPLMEAAHATGMPLIVSLGMVEAHLGPPAEADIVLHCISKYPSRIEDANLRVLIEPYMRWWLMGLSDHTPGYETAIAATALGAVMIEKHFKLDDNCIDAAYSLDPHDFAVMCKAVRAIWHGMGDGIIRPTGQPRQR